MFESLLVHTTPKLMPIVRPVMLVASSWKLELDLVGTGANLARISIDILGTKRNPQANAMLLMQYYFCTSCHCNSFGWHVWGYFLVETIFSVTGTAIHCTELILVSLMINRTWLPQYQIWKHVKKTINSNYFGATFQMHNAPFFMISEHPQ